MFQSYLFSFFLSLFDFHVELHLERFDITRFRANLYQHSGTLSVHSFHVFHDDPVNMEISFYYFRTITSGSCFSNDLCIVSISYPNFGVTYAAFTFGVMI